MKFRYKVERRLAECAVSFCSPVIQLNNTSAGRNLAQNDLSEDSGQVQIPRGRQARFNPNYRSFPSDFMKPPGQNLQTHL